MTKVVENFNILTFFVEISKNEMILRFEILVVQMLKSQK